MKLSSLLVSLTLLIVPALADLTCLQWAFISPLVSAICFFKPDTASKIENATVAAVEKAVDDAKELIEFDLTHNPVVVGWNYAKIAHDSGWSDANSYIRNITTDFGQVTIGFGKESVNQAYSLFNVLEWNDYTYCVIRDAVKQAKAGKQGVGRRGLKRRAISDIDAAGIAKRCLSDKFSRGPIFNISEGNEHVGATISEVAAFFVPVAPEGEIFGNAAAKSFDLALPGAEEAGRIFKQGEAGLARAEHFASEAEAQKVAKALQEEGWQAKNCGICGTGEVSRLPGVTGPIATGKRGLQRRGGAFSMCCNPQAAETVALDVFQSAAQSTEIYSPVTSEGESVAGSLAESLSDAPDEFYGEYYNLEDGLPTYNPKDYNIIPENKLVPPRDFKLQNLYADTGSAILEGISKDLATSGASLVPYSPELKSLMDSKTVLKTVRDAFENPGELATAMQARYRDKLGRIAASSNKWDPDYVPPILKPLFDWSEAATKDGAAVYRKLNPDFEGHLAGNVEMFYVPPGKQGIIGADPRGFHTDSFALSFGAADVPGLVVKDLTTGAAERVKIQDNTFHLFTGNRWDLTKLGVDHGLEHAVYGPEMAEKGRCSLIVTITPNSFGEL